MVEVTVVVVVEVTVVVVVEVVVVMGRGRKCGHNHGNEGRVRRRRWCM